MRKKKCRVYVITSNRNTVVEDVEKAVYHPITHTLEIFTHSPLGVYCHQIVTYGHVAKIRSTGIRVKVGDH
jgi:hypothetical protein